MGLMTDVDAQGEEQERTMKTSDQLGDLGWETPLLTPSLDCELTKPEIYRNILSVMPSKQSQFLSHLLHLWRMQINRVKLLHLMSHTPGYG